MKKEELAAKFGISPDVLDRQVASSQQLALKQGQEREMTKAEGATFAELSRNHPSVGTVLTSEDGKPVLVYEDWKVNEGNPVRILFANAAIDRAATGWYLHARNFGLKCLITLRSYDRIPRDEEGQLIVTKLRVIRETRSGRGLICEVVE